MKIIVVGDRVVSCELLVEATRNLEIGNIEKIIDVYWPTEDRKDFQKKAHNIELNGPNAEKVPIELYDYIEDADILLTHFCPVPKELIEKAKNLKLIGTCRGGMEHIDVEYATSKNIPVIHCIRNAEATSDFTIGLIFAETRNIARAHAAMKMGQWRKEYINSNYTTNINSMTLGIVGLGHIGKLVAKKATGLGMKVIAYDPFVDELGLKLKNLDITLMDQSEVFKLSDVISLHLRVTPETEGTINMELFKLMKPTAYIINTSRAKAINKSDFIEALEKKIIGGAALDVYWDEPLNIDDPLLNLDNVTLTPHNAGNVVDALPKSPRLLVKEINEFYINGNTDMVVNYKNIKLERE